MMRWLICAAAVLLCVACEQEEGNKVTSSWYDLTSWKVRQVGTNDWFSAAVPGCVHNDLLAAGLIPDPYVSTNEQAVQWVEETAWEYQTTLSVSQREADARRLILKFPALDTYATILLNGDSIGSSHTAFLPVEIDLTGTLASGEHTLTVQFLSPIKQNATAARDGLNAPTAQNDASPLKVSPWTRKPAHQFGWDWAPRLVTCGFPAAPTLAAFFHPSIVNPTVVSTSFNPQTKRGTATVECQSVDLPAGVQPTLHIGGKDFPMQQQAADPSKWRGTLTLENATPWYPVGLGEQVFHNAQIRQTDGDRLVATNLKVAFRTVELVQQKDSIGTSFYLKVNNKPVYARGANMVPPQALRTADYEAKLLGLVRDMQRSNFNMVRVWGGGEYLPNSFYHACDTAGIMVWQDFMFANCIYPATHAFTSLVQQEVAHQAKRLNGHPSIALWCGNNEIDVAWNNWGWQKAFGIHGTDSAHMIAAHKQLFQQTIPNTLQNTVGSSVPYVHTSPLSNWGTPKNFNHHNMHYWGVWHAEETFAQFANNVPRFMTEYGFQSFPGMETVAQFADSLQWDIDSEVMAARQKSYKGTRLITDHMQRHFNVPTNFEDYTYVSQLLHAKAMRLAINAHRTAKPHCMGTLYWQLNDCWPAISWSGIDAAGQWKASQYMVKNRYADVLVVAERVREELHITLVSDAQQPTKGELILQHLDTKTNSITQETLPVSVHANSVKTLSPINAFGDVTRAVLVVDGDVYSVDVALAVQEKELILLEPNVELSIRLVRSNVYAVTLRSDVYVHGMHLASDEQEGWFSNNFFSLFPGELATVYYHTNSDGSGLPNVFVMNVLNTVE